MRTVVPGSTAAAWNWLETLAAQIQPTAISTEYLSQKYLCEICKLLYLLQGFHSLFLIIYIKVACTKAITHQQISQQHSKSVNMFNHFLLQLIGRDIKLAIIGNMMKTFESTWQQLISSDSGNFQFTNHQLCKPSLFTDPDSFFYCTINYYQQYNLYQV